MLKIYFPVLKIECKQKLFGILSDICECKGVLRPKSLRILGGKPWKRSWLCCVVFNIKVVCSCCSRQWGAFEGLGAGNIVQGVLSAEQFKTDAQK